MFYWDEMLTWWLPGCKATATLKAGGTERQAFINYAISCQPDQNRMQEKLQMFL